jgi:hypothetical protein
MVQKHFNDFLNGPENYAACERHWEGVIREIEQSLVESGEWRRWIPRYNVPWTSENADGGVIIDGRSEKLDRAFRVMLHRFVGDDPWVAAWLKTYEEEYVELPREELVISLSPSVESEQIAKNLLKLWMTPSTTLDQMQLAIRPYQGK